MTNALIAIYIFIYIIWSIAAIISDFNEEYSGWVIALNIIVSVFGVFGMICYLAHVQNIAISIIWKGVFFGIIIGQTGLFGIDFYDQWKDENTNLYIALLSIYFAILFEIPCLVLNYLVAFRI
jgi:hypothetical protein